MTSSNVLQGTRILIAEDEALVAMDLLDMVEAAGGEVVGPCSSVRACEAALENGEPVAALLDVRLGKEEVFGVAETIAEKGIAIVFHSGHADAEAILTRFPHARFLPKPASERQLLGALAAVIDRDNSIAAE